MSYLKSRFATILLGFSVVFFVGCSSDANDNDLTTATEVSAENIIVADYAVEGMVCAHGCAKTIQDELTGLDGVVACNVSFEDGSAHVEFDKTVLTETEVVALIEGVAEGQYKAKKRTETKDEVDVVEEDNEGEVVETITEVSLPDFELPNLFSLLFNQL